MYYCMEFICECEKINLPWLLHHGPLQKEEKKIKCSLEMWCDSRVIICVKPVERLIHLLLLRNGLLIKNPLSNINI